MDTGVSYERATTELTHYMSQSMQKSFSHLAHRYRPVGLSESSTCGGASASVDNWLISLERDNHSLMGTACRIQSMLAPAWVLQVHPLG